MSAGEGSRGRMIGQIGRLFRLMILLALIVVIGLWVSFEVWLAAALRWVLPEAAGKVEYSRASISPWGLSLSDLVWRTGGYALSVNELRLALAPLELASGKMDSLLLDGLSVSVDLEVVEEGAAGSPELSWKELEAQIAEWMKVRIPQMPIRRVVIPDALLKVHRGENESLSGHFSIYGRVDKVRQSLSFEGKLSGLEYNGLLEHSLKSDAWVFGLGFASADVSAWLARMEGLVSGVGDRWKLGGLAGSLEWKREESGIHRANLQCRGESFAVDTFAQAAELSLRVEVEGLLDFFRMDLTCKELKAEGFGMGDALELTLEGRREPGGQIDSLALDGELRARGLAWNRGDESWLFDPVSLQFEGNTGGGRVELGRVASRAFPVGLSGGTLEVRRETGTAWEGRWELLAEWMGPGNLAVDVEDGEPLLRLVGDLVWEPELDGFLPRTTMSRLLLPQAAFSHSGEEGSVQLVADARIDVMTRSSELQAGAAFEAEKIRLSVGDWKVEEGMLATRLETPAMDVRVFEDFESAVLLDTMDVDVEAALRGRWQQTAWEVDGLTLVSAQLPEGGKDGLTLGIGSLRWEPWRLGNVDLKIDRAWPEIRVSGGSWLMDPSLSLAVEGLWTSESASFDGLLRLGAAEGARESSLVLGGLLPDGGSIGLRGKIEAASRMRIGGEGVRMDLDAELGDVGIVVASMELEVSGLRVDPFRMESLVPVAMDQPLNLTFTSLRLNKLFLDGGGLKVQTMKDGSIRIPELSFGWCKGTVSILEPLVLSAPWKDIQIRLGIREVEASEIIALIPEFKGELSGRLEGEIPLRIGEGSIHWGTGFLRLMDGQQGRFRQVDTRWLDPYLPPVVIDPQRNIMLNQAVQDMMITEMRLDLIPSHLPEPSVLLLRGHSLVENSRIPIDSIRINLRGDIEESVNMYLGFDRKLRQGFRSEEK